MIAEGEERIICVKLCANLPTCKEPYCDCYTVCGKDIDDEELRIEREKLLGVSVLTFPVEDEDDYADEEEEEEEYCC